MTCTYLYAAPASELANGKKSPIDVVGSALFGTWGGTLVFLLISVSVIGCLNANVLAGPRILYAMAKDGLFFRGALHVHAKTRVPTPAIWIQAAISCGLVLVLGTFPKVLQHTTFAIVLATIADIGALYMLRRKYPDRPRPYKTAGYPWLPLLYALANIAIGVSMLRDKPKECGLAIVELVLAVPVYFVFRRLNAGAPLPAKEE
jgi:APA family basic amino acid/polyamine antiporter